VIGLKQQNMDVIDKLFWERSNPRHKDWRKWLTNDEVTALVAPKPETTIAVQTWLRSHGVESTVSGNTDVLLATATLAQIEKLFGVTYTVWSHTSGKTRGASLGPYTVPAAIAPHIDIVAGVVGLPSYRSNVLVGSQEESTSTLSPGTTSTSPHHSSPTTRHITPEQVRASLGIPSTLVGTAKNNKQAVAEFQNQDFNPADLVQFLKTYSPLNKNTALAGIFGQNTPSNPSIETALDTQYIMSTAPNVPTYMYAMANDAFYTDLFKWQAFLASQNDTELPYVHTISYGSQGDYPTNQFQRRADGEFAKIGLRGRTIVFASGDDGAGCSPPGLSSLGTGGQVTETTANTFTPTTGEAPASGVDETCSGVVLDPSYPATSIYITAAGATKFINGNTGPVAAVSAFLSGGGFSYTYPIPEYQQSAVATYLKTASVLPSRHAFNSSGRGTPDVSSLGDIHFQVIVSGAVTPVGGTSASAPPTGGMFSLVNDALFNAGKSSIGPVNQLLYQAAASDPTAFADSSKGSNQCSLGFFSLGFDEADVDETSQTASPELSTPTVGCGFVAAPGWDPVTGLGTPQFPSILKLAQA
jgi:tripeptidyl-peptidase-1